MIEAKVNAFDARMAPPVGVEEVARFLAAVGRGLRVRSDSELARSIGVAPSTVASWKARGSIPEDHAAWFKANLIPKLVHGHDDLPACGLVARSAVIELLARTHGNPLGVQRLTLTVGASMLAPLLALAEMLAELEGGDRRTFRSELVYRVVELMEGAMPAMRQTLSQDIV